jgi:hypothetical protein
MTINRAPDQTHALGCLMFDGNPLREAKVYVRWDLKVRQNVLSRNGTAATTIAGNF